MSNAEESGESVHPWPYLLEIFAYKSKAGNSVKLICVLCVPKELSAASSVVSHLHSVGPTRSVASSPHFPDQAHGIIRCKNLALYIRDCVSLCLSDETLKSRWSLLSGVYARGSKISHQSALEMCNLWTPHSSLEKDNSLNHSCVSPKMGCLEYTN